MSQLQLQGRAAWLCLRQCHGQRRGEEEVTLLLQMPLLLLGTQVGGGSRGQKGLLLPQDLPSRLLPGPDNLQNKKCRGEGRRC